MKPEVTAELVTDVLVVAIWRRGKPDRLQLGDLPTKPLDRDLVGINLPVPGERLHRVRRSRAAAPR